MYSVYNNFQLHKDKDCVKIFADRLLVLESEEDEQNLGIDFPKYLNNLLELKFPVDKYEKYNLYFLMVNNPNRITDYKKIWKLGGFDSNGLYDNFYVVDSGRIYFGITKKDPKFAMSVWMKKISILIDKEQIPRDIQFIFESIFNFFAINKFGYNFNIDRYDDALKNISKIVKNSVVVHKIFANKVGLNLYGDGIEQKFDLSELPKNDIIEICE